MSEAGTARVLWVLSDEHRIEYDSELASMRRPDVEFLFENSPEDALDEVSDLAPNLVVVGMTHEEMDGLEFLARMLGVYKDYAGKIIVLPEKDDPFPPMLQFRDPATGRSGTEEIELGDVGRFVTELVQEPVEAAPPQPETAETRRTRPAPDFHSSVTAPPPAAEWPSRWLAEDDAPTAPPPPDPPPDPPPEAEPERALVSKPTEREAEPSPRGSASPEPETEPESLPESSPASEPPEPATAVEPEPAEPEPAEPESAEPKPAEPEPAGPEPAEPASAEPAVPAPRSSPSVLPLGVSVPTAAVSDGPPAKSGRERGVAMAIAAVAAIVLIVVAALIWATSNSESSPTEPPPAPPAVEGAPTVDASPDPEAAEPVSPEPTLGPQDDFLLEESSDFEPRSLPLRFGRGSAQFTVIDPAALEEILTELDEVLEHDVEAVVEVGGHTSGQGSVEINRHVGRTRASGVRDLLVARGIPIEKILLRNYHSSRPSDGASEGDPHEIHRRVTLRVIR